MKKRVKKTLKFFLFFLICLGLFYVLEYGPALDNNSKFIKPILLSGFTVTILSHQQRTRYILFFSIFCLSIMVLTSIINWSEISNMFGSFGFSLLIISVLSYIPQIIKKGYVEKF